MVEAAEEAKRTDSTSKVVLPPPPLSMAPAPPSMPVPSALVVDEEQIVISGAGTDIVNGLYRRKGRKNKIKVFINDNGVTLSCEIIQNQPGWICGKAPHAFYGVVSSAKIPPAAGWRCYSGASPAIASLIYIPKKNPDGNATMGTLRGDDITFAMKEYYGQQGSGGDVSNSSVSAETQETTRNAILEALIASEKKYIAFLNVMVDSFQRPLEDDSSFNSMPMISNENVVTMFSNLAMLLGLHQQLLTKFEAGRSTGQLTISVAVAFIQMQPHFFMYSTYCANLFNAWKIFIDESARSTKFSTWIKNAMHTNGFKNSFTHYLGMLQLTFEYAYK